MSKIYRPIGLSIFVASTLVVAGCGDENGAGKTTKNPQGANTKTTSTPGDSAKKTDATKTPAQKSASTIAKEIKPESKADGPALFEAKSAASAPASAKSEGKSNAVLLGSDELTSGIPGSGPLKVSEIKDWLAKPGANETLVVALPLGLNAGQPKGLEGNPLTRAKIELGRQLYFDPRLSADKSVSCASCHHPDEGWAKHTQFGVGIKGQTGGRNSPVSFNRILSDAQFWDGRAGSLEEQAKGPVANPIEMGNTHEKAVAAIAGVEGYRVEFDDVFGKNSVNIDNIAKAIASFERAVVTNPSPFDYYEALRPFAKWTKEDVDDAKKNDAETYAKYEKLLDESKKHPMSASAVRGRELFFSQRVNCAACHVGANLSDEKYHNIGVGMDKKEPDLGRYAQTKVESDKGAFKTPTIRNVALTAPYMHDGSQRTLEDVVAWYDKGGHPNPHLDAKIKPLKLTDQEKKDLVEFLKACTGDFAKIETNRLPED